jgi:hypothetical protein
MQTEIIEWTHILRGTMSTLKMETICGISRMNNSILFVHLKLPIIFHPHPEHNRYRMQFAFPLWVMEMNNLKDWKRVFLADAKAYETWHNSALNFLHHEAQKRTKLPLTSHISRKSCCSTRNNSHVVFVTTVLSRGKSWRTDSPKVAPTPRLQSVIGLWKWEKNKNELIELSWTLLLILLWWVCGFNIQWARNILSSFHLLAERSFKFGKVYNLVIKILVIPISNVLNLNKNNLSKSQFQPLIKHNLLIV